MSAPRALICTLATARRFWTLFPPWWVTLHGHAHPTIARAIADQARRLEQVIFAGFTHAPAEELAVRLRRILPRELAHVFFSDDGSTAVEVALKLAVQYWWNLGQAEKNEIVALENAYHGDTLGAMSVSADSAFTAPFQSLRRPVHRVPSADCFSYPAERTRGRCPMDGLDKLRTLLAERSSRIAAVILEPLLQGAGGMIVHPPEFLQGIREFCNEHHVLLIADEVLTGFGDTERCMPARCGGRDSRLDVCAKGLTGGFLPLAATLCTRASTRRSLIRTAPAAFFRTFVHGQPHRLRRRQRQSGNLLDRAGVRPHPRHRGGASGTAG